MLNILSDLLWVIASLLIFIMGMYFTIKIKFKNFNFIKMIKTLFDKNNKSTISIVQTLTINLATKIGVGSITGIALAIYLGGIGSIFWMWITAFIASSNTFVESILGVIYHEKDFDEVYKGGPSYYISKGLKNKKLAILYSLIIVFSFSIGFLMIQSNTITLGLVDYFNFNPLIIGVIISFITGLVILKGIKSIAKVTNLLVPFMGCLYILICLIIILLNLDTFFETIILIIKDAFSLKAGIVGILTTFIIGMQKGIFSNECGLGTAAIVASTTSDEDYTKQGYIQTLAVYIDTLLIGTATAFIVILSNISNLNIKDANGIEIVKYAFETNLGEVGSLILVIIIVLFAFTTIISGYYYTESNFKFIKTNYQKKDIILLKIITLIMIITGSFLSSSLVWKIVDILVAILAIINIYSLWMLKDKIKKS